MWVLLPYFEELPTEKATYSDAVAFLLIAGIGGGALGLLSILGFGLFVGGFRQRTNPSKLLLGPAILTVSLYVLLRIVQPNFV